MLRANLLRQFIFLRIFALTALLISLSLATPLHAQNASSSAKKQRLEWKNDANAFEYNVQVRSVENGKIYEFVTESNFIEFSLPAGNYEWKVSAKDFLGREQSSTKWQGFEIRKMVQPEIKKVTKKVVVDVSKSSAKTEIPLEAQGVEKDADVRLVNSKNGKTVQGKIEKDVAVFPKVDDGEWKLRVTNKSGLSTESEAITITDTEAIEKARLEEERRIAEAKRLEEEKRLAAEKAAFEAAEKARIAAEQAAEKERLAAEQAAEKERLSQEKEAEKARVAEEKATEKERLAQEKAAAEEEKQRLAEEKAAEKERLAEEKKNAAEQAAEEAMQAKVAKKEDRKNRPEKNFAGVYWTAGSGCTSDLSTVTSFLDFFRCLGKMDFSDYVESSSAFLNLFPDYPNAGIEQVVFASDGTKSGYFPFLGLFPNKGFYHSYDTKLEYMPWKFAGFEAGFGLQFSPTVISVMLESSTFDASSIYRYYQMELYPISVNAQLLIPIAKKRRWLGIKAGGGMLLTHAYQIYAHYKNSNFDSIFGDSEMDLISAFSDSDVSDVSGFGQKYGETYFVNYMLTAGAFFRLVSYHGFVVDFGLDYVYWNIADFSVSNLLANFSIGVKL